MKIKCPTCKNSGTIALMWEDRDGYSTIHTREYECKCGCVFEVNFIASTPTILQKPIDKFTNVCYNNYRK